MNEIRVDPYGQHLMTPKATAYLIRINSISNITANILKQEMLSLGADAAIARDSLTGKTKLTDCLLISNLAQLNRLQIKLNKQPFGLGILAQELKQSIVNYEKTVFTFKAGRFSLPLGRRTMIMGIINMTPDSFSQDGIFASNLKAPVEAALRLAERLSDEGADIIDIGGESSRPGAKPVSLKEELERTIPLIKLLAKRSRLPISIDTSKPEVARQALDNGASIINDICALGDKRMRKITAQYKAGAIIMHMKGNPQTMQNSPVYQSLIDEIITYLGEAVKSARDAGIDNNRIIIDPGIGFGKTTTDNLEILRKLKEFKILGLPILVGTSRKGFIGKITKAENQDRINGTLATCVIAAKNGASIVRVHDVKQVKQALSIADSINR